MSTGEVSLYFDPGLLDRGNALAFYQRTRARSLELAAPLSAEDMTIQSMPDVSPTKWHLGHTTWFFETFILSRFLPSYTPFDKVYAYLFNSYYEAAGPRHPRPRRGLLSRPPLEDVLAFRHHVDEAMACLLELPGSDDGMPKIAPLLDLGCNHEEQHQELMLTDIKHVLSCNPLKPAYQAALPTALTQAPKLAWHDFAEGVREIGHDHAQEEAFAYDCEGPRHKVYLMPFALASRCVTNGEYLEFIGDGGYERADLWLSDGWAAVQTEGWHEPLYWSEQDGARVQFTLQGERPLDPAEPVCHLNYFEADAFARWSGARLPREAELEIAVAELGADYAPNDLSTGRLHPAPAAPSESLAQLAGDVWEWTMSDYAPYPGFKPSEGAVGEYNGKFMCNQHVLKGGSCVTPAGHARPTYRNFFYPHQNWQFTGLRLAKDLD